MKNEPQQFLAESQKERWLKYGVNVGVAIVAVLVIAALVTWLSQQYNKRIDTTAGGLYSLKPQTVNLIKDNEQKIKLVSLYITRTERDEPTEYAGPVADLLDEYASKGSNIEAEAIDPIREPAKVDQLVADAINKYGGAIKQYKDFLNDFETTYKTLQDLSGAEAAAVAGFQTEGLDPQSNLGPVIGTIRTDIPEHLRRMKEQLDSARKRSKYPDYKMLVDEMVSSTLSQDDLDRISTLEAALAEYAKQAKDMAQVPQALRDYFATAAERFEQIQKLVDDTIDKIHSLGELKVGDLQRDMKSQNLILVLGEDDWRVINPSQVWTTDLRDLRAFTDQTDIKPRFAGEQAVTTAILSLTSDNKPKVVFIRPGGAPLTDPGFPPFQRSGPFSELAERLRDYNFEVLERDISGMYAMQAQMQGMTPQPEPSDAEIADATWIVLDIPGSEAPTALGPRLKAHLDAGGSALVLTMPEADSLAETLRPYGIDPVTDAMLVHEVPEGERLQSTDIGEEVQRIPYVMQVQKYGDHMLTGPLESLRALIVRGNPVRTVPAEGVKVTPLLPVPEAPLKIWGERDFASVSAGAQQYDETGVNADIPGPFMVGAAAEKGETRLVVLGALPSFTNEVLTLPDAEMLKRRVVVARFPGNSELFTNSVFWLAHMEPMIAISPAAMQVSRIASMGEFAQNFWRWGVLVVILPGLVLAAGITMYFSRRD